MNAQQTDMPATSPAGNAAFANARRVTAQLCQFAALHLLFVFASLLPVLAAGLHRAGFPARPVLLIACAALAVSSGNILATALVTAARARALRRATPSAITRAAGSPQALLLCAGAAMTFFVLHAAWTAVRPGPETPSAFGAVALLLAAFLLLVSERAAAFIDPASLPEAPALASAMRLPVIVLPALALICMLPDRLPVAVQIGSHALAGLVAACALEMALRTLAVWYAPPPQPLAARAAVGSALMRMLAVVIHPRQLSPAAIGQSLTRHFGIDFARSFALAFARRASLPVLALLLCICWGLSGATSVRVNQRAIYERFGAPVAVLKPGLHVLLPWPLGRARMTEYGVVHSILLSDAAEARSAPSDTSTAEGVPPASANRMWDQSNSETFYLVARTDEGRQSFEAVSVDLRVLYRIGLSDHAARDDAYHVSDAPLLIGSLSRRLLSRALATQTLSEIMVERPDQLANALRGRLQAQLDALDSGIEIVGLVVDSLHPPAGAASAYRAVQAAQITAETAVAQEQGRARGTASLALRDARDLRDTAQAKAAETTETAQAEQTRMSADDRAWHAGGQAFLTERRFAELRAALGRAPMEIIDSRLPARLLDLRPNAATAGHDTGPDTGAEPDEENHAP